jgi:hypothetical protein
MARFRFVETTVQSSSSESIQQRNFRPVEAAVIPVTMALGPGFFRTAEFALDSHEMCKKK